MQGHGHGNEKRRAPLIGINDSGRGARIQGGCQQPSGLHRDLPAQHPRLGRDSRRFPAIFGPCAGGAAYSPALTDFIMMNQGTSYMFVTGPKVVKTVTGEEVGFQEQLGGASVHAAKSGVAHFVVDNEEDGIKTLRKLLSYLPSNNLEEAPMMACNDAIDRLEDTLNEIIP
ncbi:MAG: carboxyl transferase domain-containing protein [Alistipes indistinctus]